MTRQLTFRIVLQKPPAGSDFGLQKGKGYGYETVQKQRSTGGDLRFEFTIEAKPGSKDAPPNLLGPFVQGPPDARFVYIDIGTSAGQLDARWSRRLKVPLSGIPWGEIKRLSESSPVVFETQVPGTAKDGGPACATVKPFAGWRLAGNPPGE